MAGFVKVAMVNNNKFAASAILGASGGKYARRRVSKIAGKKMQLNTT
jgi:hypothetical protein